VNDNNEPVEGTPEVMDSLVDEACQAGNLSNAQGLIEIAAMAFPERRDHWAARWRQVRAEIARQEREMEA
jgi:hypothetical protein